MMRFVVGISAIMFVAAGPASAAVNLVTNGGFEDGYVVNTEFGTAYPRGIGPTGWQLLSPKAYGLYFDAATATTVSAQSGYAGNQELHTSFTGASPDGGKFVALDGDIDANGPLTQSIAGLTPGHTYEVAFDWGAAQLDNRTGATTERLVVGFGGASQSTATLANASEGFTGWFADRLRFTATATTETLSFLSVGTPTGLPPIAVLDGVSVTAVPEPAAWVLMVAGFGLVGVMRRRRGQAVLAA